jgi:hypothetical protein
MEEPDKMQPENILLLLKHKNIVAPSICDICDCHVFINIRCELLMLTGMV